MRGSDDNAVTQGSPSAEIDVSAGLFGKTPNCARYSVMGCICWIPGASMSLVRVSFGDHHLLYPHPSHVSHKQAEAVVVQVLPLGGDVP